VWALTNSMSRPSMVGTPADHDRTVRSVGFCVFVSRLSPALVLFLTLVSLAIDCSRLTILLFSLVPHAPWHPFVVPLLQSLLCGGSSCCCQSILIDTLCTGAPSSIMVPCFFLVGFLLMWPTSCLVLLPFHVGASSSIFFCTGVTV
jgi:hypothetical protein